MPELIFDFDDNKSGKITKSGLSYEAATGWANCDTGENTTTGLKWRAFFAFDSSSVPLGSTITAVYYYQKLRIVQPDGDPETLVIRYSMGNIIGDELNGTQAEWEGGSEVLSLTEEVNDTWIDLSSLGIPYVNKEGFTDLKVWDDSTKGSGDSSWGTNFNTVKIKCQLKVIYTVHTATLSANGSLTAAAQRTRGGTASLSSSASLTASASVLHPASASLSTSASLTAAAQRTRAAAASPTGQAALTATPQATRQATSSNTLQSILEALAQALHRAQATTLSSTSLTASASALRGAAALLEVEANLEANSQCICEASSLCSSSCFLTAAPLRIRAAASISSSTSALEAAGWAAHLGQVTLLAELELEAEGAVTTPWRPPMAVDSGSRTCPSQDLRTAAPVSLNSSSSTCPSTSSGSRAPKPLDLRDSSVSANDSTTRGNRR